VLTQERVSPLFVSVTQSRGKWQHFVDAAEMKDRSAKPSTREPPELTRVTLKSVPKKIRRQQFCKWIIRLAAKSHTRIHLGNAAVLKNI